MVDGFMPSSNSTHTTTVLSTGTVAGIVSTVGGTTTTIIVVSHCPLVLSQTTTHTVSLPTTALGVNTKQPLASTVTSTTVPLVLVLPSHNVVVVTLPDPNGLSIHKVSGHVLQMLSTIVSVGGGVTVISMIVVSQIPVLASQATTQIGASLPALSPAVYVTQPSAPSTASPNVPFNVPVLPSQ